MDPLRASGPCRACGPAARPAYRFFAPVAGRDREAAGGGSMRVPAGGLPGLRLCRSGFEWNNTKSTVARSPKTLHSVAQEPGETPTVASLPVKFKVLHPTEFGETIKIVGGGVLGEWELDNAIGLEWQEDDVWVADTELAPGNYEFKCVKICGDSSVVWEPGSNRTLEVPEQPEVGGMLEVDCLFWDTLSTSSSMSFDEADDELVLEGLDEVEKVEEVEEVEESSGNGTAAGSSSTEVTEGQAALQAEEATETAEEESTSVTEAATETSAGEAGTETGDMEEKEEAEEEDEVVVDATEEKEDREGDVLEAAVAVGTDTVTTREADESAELGAGQPPSAAGTKSPQVAASSSGPVDTIVIVGGLVSIPVMAWSMFTLKTTGCGLPPGPGGLLGGLEGVSYLAVLAIAGRGLLQRTMSSSSKELAGLPSGTAGVVGLVETMSYVTLLVGAVVLGLQVLDYGYVPSVLPDDHCSAEPTALTFDLKLPL